MCKSGNLKNCFWYSMQVIRVGLLNPKHKSREQDDKARRLNYNTTEYIDKTMLLLCTFACTLHYFTLNVVRIVVILDICIIYVTLYYQTLVTQNQPKHAKSLSVSRSLTQIRTLILHMLCTHRIYLYIIFVFKCQLCENAATGSDNNQVTIQA